MTIRSESVVNGGRHLTPCLGPATGGAIPERSRRTVARDPEPQLNPGRTSSREPGSGDTPKSRALCAPSFDCGPDREALDWSNRGAALEQHSRATSTRCEAASTFSRPVGAVLLSRRAVKSVRPAGRVAAKRAIQTKSECWARDSTPRTRNQTPGTSNTDRSSIASASPATSISSGRERPTLSVVLEPVALSSRRP